MDAARTPVAAPLVGLPATRRRLIEALKREGEATVETLAAELGLTVNGVRQHLHGLELQGLVEHREERSGPGRPPHLYQLTPAAATLFPKADAELASELLDYVAAVEPELLEQAFGARARRRLGEAMARLEGRPFAERVQEVARILDEDGYLAELVAQPDGSYRLVEHNCAILGIAQRHPRACVTELEFLRESLPDADIERTSHIVQGQHACCYLIVPR